MSGPYAETVLTEVTSAQTAPQDRRPVLLGMLGAACISSSAILVTLAGASATVTAFLRCFFALPVLVVLATVERRRTATQLAVRDRLLAATAGLFLALDLVFWNHAIIAVGAGIATVLGNLQVLVVALAGWLLWRERPARGVLVALPVVMVGVVLVSGLIGPATAHTDPAAGIGFGVATSLSYAAFLLILRRATARTNLVAAPLADATAGAALGSLLIGLVLGGLEPDLSAASIGWLALLALTSQTIGWLLITSALPRLPAALSSLLLLLQPAAAVVLAALILGERPSPAQLLGAAIVCCGVLAVSRSAVRPGQPAVD